MLDEGLAILTGLWRGETFSYEGAHYHVKEAQFLPKPVQSPRIPIWIAGLWPNKPPFRRAWVERYIAADLKCIFGDAADQDCPVRMASPTHFIVERLVVFGLGQYRIAGWPCRPGAQSSAQLMSKKYANR